MKLLIIKKEQVKYLISVSYIHYIPSIQYGAVIIFTTKWQYGTTNLHLHAWPSTYASRSKAGCQLCVTQLGCLVERDCGIKWTQTAWWTPLKSFYCLSAGFICPVGGGGSNHWQIESSMIQQWNTEYRGLVQGRWSRADVKGNRCGGKIFKSREMEGDDRQQIQGETARGNKQTSAVRLKVHLWTVSGDAHTEGCLNCQKERLKLSASLQSASQQQRARQVVCSVTQSLISAQWEVLISSDWTPGLI